MRSVIWKRIWWSIWGFGHQQGISYLQGSYCHIDFIHTQYLTRCTLLLELKRLVNDVVALKEMISMELEGRFYFSHRGMTGEPRRLGISIWSCRLKIWGSGDDGETRFPISWYRIWLPKHNSTPQFSTIQHTRQNYLLFRCLDMRKMEGLRNEYGAANFIGERI